MMFGDIHPRRDISGKANYFIILNGLSIIHQFYWWVQAMLSGWGGGD
jgi:hypothetical protein